MNARILSVYYKHSTARHSAPANCQCDYERFSTPQVFQSRGAFSHATCNSNKGGENEFYKLVKAQGAARPIICMSKFVNHYVKLLTASQVSEIL